MSEYQIPTSANQVLIVSKYELLMFLRGKKIFAMIGITVAISALFIGVFQYLQEQGPRSLEFDLASPISFVFFLIVIIAAFFGSSSISSEFNQKTGHVLFSNPVSRTSVWFGKFIAAQIVSFSVISLYYSIMVAYAGIVHEVPVEILASLGFSFVSSTMIMSIAFLASSIFRGHAGAIILVFALFIIVFPAADGFMTLMLADKPWYTPTFASGIIKHILTIPYPADEETPAIPFFANSSVPNIAHSLGVMISYIVVSSALSILILKRRELT